MNADLIPLRISHPLVEPLGRIALSLLSKNPKEATKADNETLRQISRGVRQTAFDAEATVLVGESRPMQVFARVLQAEVYRFIGAADLKDEILAPQSFVKEAHRAIREDSPVVWSAYQALCLAHELGTKEYADGLRKMFDQLGIVEKYVPMRLSTGDIMCGDSGPVGDGMSHAMGNQ